MHVCGYKVNVFFVRTLDDDTAKVRANVRQHIVAKIVKRVSANACKGGAVPYCISLCKSKNLYIFFIYIILKFVIKDIHNEINTSNINSVQPIDTGFISFMRHRLIDWSVRCPLHSLTLTQSEHVKAESKRLPCDLCAILSSFLCCSTHISKS